MKAYNLVIGRFFEASMCVTLYECTLYELNSHIVLFNTHSAALSEHVLKLSVDMGPKSLKASSVFCTVVRWGEVEIELEGASSLVVSSSCQSTTHLEVLDSKVGHDKDLQKWVQHLVCPLELHGC